MIYGTSKKVTKSGPIDFLFITKMLQTIQEIMGTCLKNSVFHLKTWKSVNWKPQVPFLWGGKLRVPDVYQFSQRRAPENDEDPCKTVFKISDMNLISIEKNMNWEFGNFFIFK